MITLDTPRILDTAPSVGLELPQYFHCRCVQTGAVRLGLTERVVCCSVYRADEVAPHRPNFSQRLAPCGHEHSFGVRISPVEAARVAQQEDFERWGWLNPLGEQMVPCDGCKQVVTLMSVRVTADEEVVCPACDARSLPWQVQRNLRQRPEGAPVLVECEPFAESTVAA